MNTEFHSILAQSKILHTFTQFLMFEFIQRNKRQIAEGNCLILQSKRGETQQTNVYLKMNNLDYLKKITDNLFVKITYQKSTAYIFFHQVNQNVVYAITTLNKSAYLPTLDELLRTKGQVIQYQSPSLKYEIKLKIDYHCEKIRENEIIVYFNTTAKIGKTIGNFFGSISQKLSKSVSTAQKTINNKFETVSRESFSNQTRSKWQTLKEKASNLNEKLTDMIKPVTEKASELAEKVSESYNKSQNSIIKTVRQFTKQAQSSINEGYIQENKQVQDTQVADNINNVQSQLQTQNTQKRDLKEGIMNGAYPVI